MPQPSMEPLEPSGPDAGAQEVNPVYLQQLRELDIPEEAAKQVRAPRYGDSDPSLPNAGPWT